jgi:hypothetical protein
MHAVSLTPHARCMSCHWHRMQNKIFEQLQKVKIICKTAMQCQKNWKCMRCQWHRKLWHRMHNRRTIRTALAAFKGNIYQNIYVPELSYKIMFPHCPKKYLNLEVLPNNKFSYVFMRCHWIRMHDFSVRISIISRRIRSRIQKGVSLGSIVWWK